MRIFLLSIFSLFILACDKSESPKSLETTRKSLESTQRIQKTSDVVSTSNIIDEIDIIYNSDERNNWSKELEFLANNLPLDAFLVDIDLKGTSFLITIASYPSQSELIIPVLNNFIKNINENPSFKDDFCEFELFEMEETTLVDNKEILISKFRTIQNCP